MTYLSAYNFLVSLNNIPREEYLKSKKKSGIYLKRLQFLLDILGNPEQKIPHYIHVTGTSGKGSVCLMLESILRASGKKTGLLTSPHPSAITERWAINGREMSNRNFALLTEKIKPALEKYLNTSLYDFPSFFEIITAMGLLYFAEQKIEWAIIEVGLGGKNDSTNVIPRKDLAIITNIGMDHENLIGPTKIDIAKEKVGIIKNGCKVLTMESDENILKIIKNESRKQKADLQVVDDESCVLFKTNIIGDHQQKNIKLAATAAKIIGLDDKSIAKGISSVKLPLRLEIVSKKPLVILDGAHNIDKMRATVDGIKNVIKPQSTHLIIGFSADKNIQAMLKQLAELRPTTIAITRSTSNPFRKVADPRLIKKLLDKLIPNAETKIFIDPPSAYKWSLNKVKKNELILVTGSFFLSGELRDKLTLKRK